MKRNKFLTVCLVLAMLMMCCACSNTDKDPGTTASTGPEELTAAQIAEKMQEALTDTPCSKMQTVMDMSMSIDAGEAGKVDMGLKNTTELTITQNPVSSYAVATIDMNIAGENSQTTSESYAIVENNEIVSYVNSSGIWMKIPTGQSAEDYSKATTTFVIDTTNIAIDESITEWNGKKVVALKFDVTGGSLQETVDGILGSMGSLGGNLDSAADMLDAVDYTKLKCSSVIYLDAETYLPLFQQQTFEGMTEVMASVYEQLGISVEVSACTADVTFASFDAQAEIKLPEGAAEKAEAWTRLLANEPDNGDGTFTIREGMVLIDLTHPEGFEVAEKDYDHVTFKRDDYRQITYTMSYITGEQTLGSGEYFINENNKSEERWTTMGGGKVQRQQIPVATDTLTFTCDLLATTWESGREDAKFYAWTPLANDGTGTYYLYIEVTDGYNDGMGFSKNADITSDEFTAYLNAAAPSKVTTE